MVTHQQLTRYRDSGFVIVEGFFSRREVLAMVSELERFKREGLIRNVATDGDGKTASKAAANLQVIPLNDKSTLFRALPFAPKVAAAVETLAGGPFVRYLDQIFLKPGRHGAGTRWHQDNAYFKVSDPTTGVGMWVALHNASLDNGTLELVPGSYRDRLEHRRDLGSNHHIFCDVDESASVPVIVEAGGVVFFNWGVAHCTRGNMTDRERAGLAYHFLRADAVPRERSINASPPVFITGPDATAGVREYGQDVSNDWEPEVDRLTRGLAAIGAS